MIKAFNYLTPTLLFFTNLKIPKILIITQKISIIKADKLNSNNSENMISKAPMAFNVE